MSIGAELKTINDLPVLELRGSIDDADVDDFVEQMETLIKAGHAKVVIDISRITFVGSFGLGKVVSYNARMKKLNRELVLLNTNPDPETFIASMLRLTNLYKVLRIVTDIAEA
jgi:anti-sigma B factor antagonist